MRKLLRSPRNNIVKEAAWTISNITAGNATQIQFVIDEGLFEDVCEVLQGGEFRSQKEAAWVITNVTSSGTEQQIFYLIEQVGILKPFCELMGSKDARCVLVILSGLKNLFALADKRGFLEKFSTVIDINFTFIDWKYVEILRNWDFNVFFLWLIHRYSKVLVHWICWSNCKSMKTTKCTNKFCIWSKPILMM